VRTIDTPKAEGGEWLDTPVWEIAAWVVSRHSAASEAAFTLFPSFAASASLGNIACMRKLLIILNAILRDKRPWQTP
jgi:hypothetical protein